MKKQALLWCIFFLVTYNCYSQVAFYDATNIRNNLVNIASANFSFKTDPTSVQNLSAYLRNYLPDNVRDNSTLTEDQILSQFATNPFFGNQIQILRGGGMSPTPAGFFSKAVSGIGNLDVTNFADGLAKFLIERSKEELNVAFFRKFQDFLKNYPEAKILFPSTVSIINNIAAYNYTAMLPALRASFQKDLNLITTSLLNLRDDANYETCDTCTLAKERAKKISDFLNNDIKGRSISGAIIAADEVIKGNNAADVIKKLATDRICIPNDIFSNSIQFVDLLSESLRSNDEGRVWITKQQVADLVTDETTLKIYLGLLYAADQKRSRHISFKFSASDSTDLKTILTVLSSTWNNNGTSFKEIFNNVAIAASEVSDNAKNIIAVKKESDQSSILVYANYASSVSNFLKIALKLLPKNTNIDPSLSNINADLQKFISVIDAATNSCYDIKAQNYGALVLHTSLLLAEIPSIPANIKDEYVKYGTFMASIVEAKNSDEVKAAIEAAVLPIGSSSIKRETSMNISLNAFIGPFAGGEYLPTLKDNQWAFSYGVTAPIGVAFSWGKKHPIFKKALEGKDPGGKSFTIFVPIIDVGSMASFRAGDDSSKVASEVTFSNIISPGLYFYWGFGKCPISIGLGGQLGPQLREVTATNINVDKNLYFRFGLNLVVDIPFFNFYTKN